MPQVFWHLILGLLSGLEQDRPRTAEVAIVFEEDASETEQEMVQELIEALAANDGVEAVLRVAFRIHTTRVGVSRPVYTAPQPGQIIADASRADRIICVGNAALSPFLDCDSLDRPVYSLGARGLSYVPTDNRLLPHLERLSGAVPLDITLAQAVRYAGLVSQVPGPMGVVVSDQVPLMLIEAGVREAREGGHTLHVERVSDPAELLPAAERLLIRGMRNLLSLPDPNCMASPAGILSKDRLRLMLLGKGVAVMGLNPGDQSSHYALEPDHRQAAQMMARMVLRDLDSPTPRPRGVQPLESFRPWVNHQLASRHSVALLPVAKAPR